MRPFAWITNTPSFLLDVQEFAVSANSTAVRRRLRGGTALMKMVCTSCSARPVRIPALGDAQADEAPSRAYTGHSNSRAIGAIVPDRPRQTPLTSQAINALGCVPCWVANLALRLM